MNRIVFGTLRRRWLRTLLTGLSTLIAFMLLGFFLAIRHGFAVGPIQSGADLLLLEPLGRRSELPLGVLSTVRTFPGVRSAVALTGTAMLFGANRHPVEVEAASAHAFLDVFGLIRSGAVRRAQAEAWLADRTGALLNAAAARTYGWRVGQSLTLHPMPGGPSQDLTFHVDGLIAKVNGDSFSSDVNLHLGYFRRWAQSDSISVIFAQATQARQVDRVAHAIELKFANSATPVTAQSFKSLLQGMGERLADVNALTFVVIATSLFGLFLICFNTLIHSVSERLGEFALLKAVGFAPLRLLWLVLLESLLEIVPAALVGMLAALLLVRALAGAKLHLPGITLTAAAFVESALIALGLAVLCSLLPGLRIVRLNCARILRRG
ncbi:MAG: ABC transporter permease [Steroidobacteraceae bacterium]